MKKLAILLIATFALFRVSAQTDGFSYQALIIDQNAQEIPGVDITGNYLVESPVSLLFTIYNSDDEVEYQEVHDTMTDAFGMVNLVIGSGESTGFGNESFNMIDWDGSSKELEVQINYGSEYEMLSREELLFLPYAYHRDVYASQDLTVEGSSTLNGESTVNSNFYVLNGGNALFGANVDIEGNSHLFGDLTVEGNTNLNGNLSVNGTTNLTDNFNVNNGAASYFSGDATFDGTATFNGGASFEDLTVQNTTTMNGPVTANSSLLVEGESRFHDQVVIDADLNGGDLDPDSYPLYVKGSNQGILIRVDGTASSENNYLTFTDADNIARGRIEGQTLSELHGSYRFLWDVAMGFLEQAFIAAEGVACSAQLDIGEATVMVANTALVGAQWVELTAYYELNVGINFSSGGADYAEYLPLLNPADDLHTAEVVGVHAGKVSRNTKGADHVMVVSSHPIVLGNQPEPGKEHEYEAIAFIGQAPTRVLGTAQKGDYIIPSGNNDGFAVAVNPSELATERFNEIIGIAWEDGTNTGSNIVNVAVGLNTNDLAGRVASAEAELDQVQKELEMLKQMVNQLISGEEVTVDSAKPVDNPTPQQTVDNEKLLSTQLSTGDVVSVEFEEWLTNYGFVFEERMRLLREKLDEIGSDYHQYPELALVIDNPTEALRQMHEGKLLTPIWDRYAKKYMIK